jgi:hypothetical protein
MVDTGVAVKEKNEEGSSTLTLLSPATTGDEGQERAGARLVTILYSRRCDLYRVPSIEKPCWLSVETYPLPPVQIVPDSIYLGPSETADGLGWRKSYAVTWRAVVPGGHATVPADDPMVVDYAAYDAGLWAAQLRESVG